MSLLKDELIKKEMEEIRLKYLIKKFHNKEINSDEHDELLELLAEENYQEIAEEFFITSWNNFNPEPNIDLEIQPSENLKKIFYKNNKIPKIKSSNYIKYAIAASLIIFCSLFLFFSKKEFNKEKIATTNILTDLEPGKNQAIITLSNNQKIVVNDRKSGLISNESNLIIKKNKNNEISIEVNKSTSKENFQNELNTISTPKGGQFTIILPDKSKVYLNAETTLIFPSDFKTHERKVSLEGEAFFEIAKNKEKPFIVETEEMSIQVLGTHFNVNSYKSEQTKSTTLVEGSVKISTPTNSKLMIPGQQADIRKGSNNISLQAVDIEQAIAWKNGYFLFIDKDLKTIMKSLSRWYNFDLKYEESFKNETFTGTVSRSQNISEILKIFETTGTVKFKIISQGNLDNERRTIIMN